jgi:hypothetical protein
MKEYFVVYDIGGRTEPVLRESHTLAGTINQVIRLFRSRADAEECRKETAALPGVDAAHISVIDWSDPNIYGAKREATA